MTINWISMQFMFISKDRQFQYIITAYDPDRAKELVREKMQTCTPETLGYWLEFQNELREKWF